MNNLLRAQRARTPPARIRHGITLSPSRPRLTRISTEVIEANATEEHLACPHFVQYGLEGCTSKVCRSTGWSSTHRLKDHLFRCHGPGSIFVCGRCHVALKTNAQLKKHSKLPKAELCEPSEEPPDLGCARFDATTEKKLRRKRKPYSPELEEVQRIYEVLFPGQGMLHSPYVPKFNLEVLSGAVFQEEFTGLVARGLQQVLNRARFVEMAAASDDITLQHGECIQQAVIVGLVETALETAISSVNERLAPGLPTLNQTRRPQPLYSLSGHSAQEPPLHVQVAQDHRALTSHIPPAIDSAITFPSPFIATHLDGTNLDATSSNLGTDKYSFQPANATSKVPLDAYMGTDAIDLWSNFDGGLPDDVWPVGQPTSVSPRIREADDSLSGGS